LVALAGAASLAWLLVEVRRVTWDRTQLDLAVYLLGAHHLVDGRLYTTGLSFPPHLPFTYPPVAALGFGPLALLPRQTAQGVWAVVNVASLYAVLALSLRAVLPGVRRAHRVLWALVLLGPTFLLDPVRLTFFFGQVNLVLCALILADLTVVLRIGRFTVPRGVLVGLAAAVKLVPLVFVPYLLVTRQARAGWTAVASFAAWSLVAAAVDPAVSWSYWTRYVDDAQRVGDPAYYLNQSLLAAVDRMAHRHVAPGAVDAGAVVVLVAGIALARWACRDSSPFLGILVCATTGLVVSPITWDHHLVWAVPVLLWLALAPDRPAGGPLWALGAALVLWWAPLEHVATGHPAELNEHGWTLLAANSFFVLLICFLVGVTLMLEVRRRRARSIPVSGPPSPASSTAATT
jgi:alpha-1,2-mannosyltransferase